MEPRARLCAYGEPTVAGLGAQTAEPNNALAGRQRGGLIVARPQRRRLRSIQVPAAAPLVQPGFGDAQEDVDQRQLERATSLELVTQPCAPSDLLHRGPAKSIALGLPHAGSSASQNSRELGVAGPACLEKQWKINGAQWSLFPQMRPVHAIASSAPATRMSVPGSGTALESCPASISCTAVVG